MGKGPRQVKDKGRTSKNVRTGSIGGTTDKPWVKSNNAGQPSRNIHKRKSRGTR